jgi:hypothetical protein
MSNVTSDIVRAAISGKPSRINVAALLIRPELNVREPDTKTWDIEGIAEDIALRGQMEPVLLEESDTERGKYLPIRGFRRSSAVVDLAKRGVIDPTTGKPFDSVVAFTVKPLSEKERYNLMIDAGNTRSLNKVEVFYAVERGLKVWDSEADTAYALRGLIDQHYPPTKEIKRDQFPLGEDGDKAFRDAYHAHRRGLMQTMRYAASSPVVLRDAYVLKTKKLQSWPTDKEMVGLYKKFAKEMDADKTRKINRTNPGAEFVKAWDDFKSKKLKDIAENGGNRPKGTGPMSADALENAQKACDSRTLKLLLDIVRRKVSQDKLATFDAFFVKAEKEGISVKDFGTMLDSVTPEGV